MGLKNAVAYFMRVMHHEIAVHKLSAFVACYLDDLIVFSNTVEEHIAHVKAVLDMLDNVGLKAHPGKSVFGADSVELWGITLVVTVCHLQKPRSRP